jgi:phospho-N-acetylmuramoyl-pentapeptide-transferase
MYDLPGAGLFNFLSFRAAAAVLLSLIVSMVFGKRIIQYLQLKQVGEIVRDLGLEGQLQKQGTPTMGGIIILSAIIIPTLLFANLTNIYVLLMLFTTVGLGLIGFVDDYIKVFKKDKAGLSGKFKIIGQVIVGAVVGATLFFHPDVATRTNTSHTMQSGLTVMDGTPAAEYTFKEEHSIKTTIPFVKNNEFDYGTIVEAVGLNAKKYGWLVFIPFVIFIITAVSNGANMTDGLDGLATGSSAIIGIGLAVLAYLSGNYIFADYLNIMFIPGSGELVIFIAAFVGACIGFLWFNAYPAQVFMGDTGSLALGGIIAVFAISIRKELLIPVLCGIFFIETVSVLLQVGYFKYTKQRTGVGKRVFLMAPLHHHYQKKGMPEPKIVARFWIIGLFLAVITIVTLKVR